MSIFLFSRPVRSGKTSELQRWCDTQKNVTGILMPDVNGKRMLQDIGSGMLFEMECDDPPNSEKPLLQVGRYYFYASAFTKANSSLLETLSALPQWLVIDEVGKLELDKKGFYPAVKQLVERYRNTRSGSNLLMVVREGLYEEVARFFKITGHTRIRHTDELAGFTNSHENG